MNAMRRFWMIGVMAVMGCSTNGTNSSVSGPLPGGGFAISDAISASISVTDGSGGRSSTARVVIASTPNLCGDASASPPIDRQLQRVVTIDLGDFSGATSTAPAAPGTYTIYPNTGTRPSRSASLVADGYDRSCNQIDADSASAQTGTVALTAIGGGAFVGTFDVVLNTGDHITGKFDPEPCPQLQAAVTTTTHQCTP